MDEVKRLAVAAGVVLLLAFGAASCIRNQRHEDCKQRGGTLVRVTGSEYRCDDPDVK